MPTGVQVWSTTAASNNTADSNVNWSEGQAPSSINDSARAEMASVAKWRDDNSGTLVTSGSSLAFTVATNQVSTAVVSGYTVTVQFHATAGTSATLATDANSAVPLQRIAGTNLAGGEYVAGSIRRFTYTSTGGSTNGTAAWLAQDTETIVGANIPAESILYNNIQGETTNTILGNVQGSAWPPQEITIGAGLVISTTSTSTALSFSSTSTSTALPYTISAPAFPPAGAFKALSIKVTGTSSATIAADYITLASTANSFLTLPAASTINFGTSGSADTLDTGSLAAGTWYAIYAIATPSSTTAHGLASTSFTTPLMPSGYTYKARVGALVTSTSTASAQLMGTWQLGRHSQYVVGLAATTATNIKLAYGPAGTYSATSPTLATVSITALTPQTASKLVIMAAGSLAGGNTTILVAPSTSWGGTNNGPQGSNLVIWPCWTTGAVAEAQTCELGLEGNTIAWTAGSSAAGIGVLGWDDNL